MERQLTPSGMDWDYHHHRQDDQQQVLQTYPHTHNDGAVVRELDWLLLKVPCESSEDMPFICGDINAASSSIKPLEVKPPELMDLDFIITTGGDGVPPQMIGPDLLASIFFTDFSPKRSVQP